MEVMKLMASILLLLLLAGQASANSLFKVVDISPIQIYPDSEANFTVTIRSVGGDGAFAEPIFNITKGLSAVEPSGLKYIVATGSRTYNCTMRAENIAPGNYSFQVGVYAQNAPYSWRTAYVIVGPSKMSMNRSANNYQNANGSLMPKTNETGSAAGKGSPAKTPGLGFLFGVAALVLAARNARD
jgi:hypothetical protein